MRNILILVLFLPLVMVGQTKEENYIHSTTYLDESPYLYNDLNSFITYDDIFSINTGEISLGETFVNILDDVLTVTIITEGLGQIHTGVIKSLAPTPNNLPNLNLGDLLLSNGNSTGYNVSIVNNDLIFTHYDTSISLGSGRKELAFSYSIDLDTEDYKKIRQVTYYDGLGRPKQTIAKRAGGKTQDIITPIIYDDFGRQVLEYLPYADPLQTTGGNLDYREQNSAFFTNLNNRYLAKYPNDIDPLSPNPFSEKRLESSPLNRIVEQGSPGESWLVNSSSDGDHTIKFNYETNNLDIDDNTADNVIFYEVIFPNGNTEEPQLFFRGYYNTNELYKTVTKDENWTSASGKNHTTEEFKNKQGQVILKRSYNTDIKHDTYYVYDNYGNLTYVLSPKGSNEVLLKNNYVTFNQSISVQEFIPVNSKGVPITSGIGSVNITLDANNNTLQVNFNLSFNTFIDLETGPIALLDEFVPNMLIGTIGNYTISTQDGFLYIAGSGIAHNIFDSFIVNLPSHSIDNTIIDNLCYQYHYDYRNRLVEKKIPGKGWEYIVYDKLDRPILTQDALLRVHNEWIFTKYDRFGRVVYTGKTTQNNLSREDIQGSVNSESVICETRTAASNTISGTQVFYNNLTFPTSNINDLYTINYYDDYAVGLSSTLDYIDSYGQTQSSYDKGLATVSKVRVLETNDWITTVTYYDEKARPIYTVSENEYLNTLDKVKSKLDFVGKVIETEATHVKDSNAPIITVDNFTYDHAGRLISQKQQLDADVPELIAKNYYDELGQLYKKEVGGETILNGYTDFVDVYEDTSRGTITKNGTNGWNAGLATKGKFHNDGFVECTAERNDRSFMFGLSPTNVNTHYNTISFAIYVAWNGVVKVYESGANLGSFGNYVAGDTFKVERVGTTINYKKNGTVFYTSAQSSIGSLVGDLSLNTNTTTVSNFRIESTTLNTVLQTVDYSYNIRGWLKQINDVDDLATNEDLFGFKLNYNDYAEGTAWAPPLYNGNISQTIWKTANTDSDKRSYAYRYDNLNRITSGQYRKADPATNILDQDADRYNLFYILYDRNGNIKRLKRNGHINNDATAFGSMDYLVYSYTGNQLEAVNDYNNNIYGYNEGSNAGGGTDYTYDANGNMVRDYSKNIGNTTNDGISYNHLNLPKRVLFNNDLNTKIDYIYDATGVKQEKQVINLGSITKTKYAGNFIYEETSAGEELKFFSHPEGYTELNTNGGSGADAYAYVYQYKDHLGNIRLAYKDANNDGAVNTSEIVEENNYYPFGLKHKGYNNVINGTDHKYGFGGKEEQDELGLGWLDVTARNYDPALGRWMNLDPLAEQMRRHSPYNYAFDNPIFWTDPDGMAPVWEPLGNGRWRAEKGDSALTLARDAGISRERAMEIMENTPKDNSSLGTMGVYEDADGNLKSAVDPGDVVTIPEQTGSSYLKRKEDLFNKTEAKIMEGVVDDAMNKISENIVDTDAKIENLEEKNDSMVGVLNGDNIQDPRSKTSKKKTLPGRYSEGTRRTMEGRSMVKEANKTEKRIDKNNQQIDSMKRLNEHRKKIKEKNK